MRALLDVNVDVTLRSLDEINLSKTGNVILLTSVPFRLGKKLIVSFGNKIPSKGIAVSAKNDLLPRMCVD
jgi:hypothetical protein